MFTGFFFLRDKFTSSYGKNAFSNAPCWFIQRVFQSPVVRSLSYLTHWKTSLVHVMVLLSWKEWNVRPLRLNRDGVEKLWLLYPMELGFQSWSVFLDTNKEWAVDIHCMFPVAVLMCAVFGYSLPYKQCVLFSFYCQFHPVHWSFLPFSLVW